MEYRSHFLVITSVDETFSPTATELKVVDLAEPASPVVVYNLEEEGARVLRGAGIDTLPAMEEAAERVVALSGGGQA